MFQGIAAYLSDVDHLKQVFTQKKEQIMAGKGCSFHLSDNVRFVQLTCTDEEIRQAFDQVIGDKGYQIDFFNVAFGDLDYPWYDTQMLIKKLDPGRDNVYSFSGLRRERIF